MSRFAKWSAVAAVLALPLLGLAAPSSADVEVSQVDWETIGQSVRFHVQFHNPDPSAPSEAVSGMMSSQPFGAFVPNSGPIGTFDVPVLAADSFFDVFFDVALSSLPPSAEMILPGGGPGNGTAPGVTGLADVCPPPTFWNGNVDIFWTPPGTGNVNYHFGQLLICPGAGNSYVHVIMDCEDPAGISWSISGLCPGWSATLVSDNGSFQPGGPAPNPIPPGFFDGWICISADLTVTTGNSCNPVLNLSCGSEPAAINVSAEACDWSSVPVEPSTWGRMKTHFGPQVEGN
jgi:hypothetical protein